MGGLITIATIFRAAARLDGDQLRKLHFIGRKIFTVNGLGLEDQSHNRHRKQRVGLFARPCVGHRVERRACLFRWSSFRLK